MRWRCFLFLGLSLGAAACGGDDDDGNGGGNSGRDGGSVVDDDLGIPSGYPTPATGEAAAARWAVDHSGFEIIPNRSVSSVSDLPVSAGGARGGAVWDARYGAFAITFTDSARNEVMTLYLPRQEPGTYAATGFDGEVTYTERTSYVYTSVIAGGHATVEIEGNNGRALWGRFSGRHCFVQTPETNCFSIYEGRFAAAVASGGETLAVDLPSGYPALSPRWSAHSGWRLDSSGFDSIPNPSVASVGELALSDGVETFGAIFDPDAHSCVLSFMDHLRYQQLELFVRTLQPGVYDLSGPHGVFEYTRDGSYRYVSDIEGGEARLEILGNDGEVVWGTFSARVCFASTPDSNCFRFYEGRFSVLNQVTAGCGTLTPPGGPG